MLNRRGLMMRAIRERGCVWSYI